MSLKPPSNMNYAIPTTRGWINPKNGELLKSQKITAADVEAFYEEKATKKVKESVAVEVIEKEPAVVQETAPTLDEIEVIIQEEELVSREELEKMTKAKLAEWAAEQDIQLDTALKKSEMIDQYFEIK